MQHVAVILRILEFLECFATFNVPAAKDEFFEMEGFLYPKTDNHR